MQKSKMFGTWNLSRKTGSRPAGEFGNSRPQLGFTLVELLIVMAILGILATLVVGGLRTAQMRGRDARRKSDLKQIGQALEMFFSDYKQYPDDSGGLIMACPYDPDGSTACNWGLGEFTDGKTVYFKVTPCDPIPSLAYFYRIVDPPNNQKFQLFARIENPRDKNCLEGDCSYPSGYSCGVSICNFAIASPNTTPME